MFPRRLVAIALFTALAFVCLALNASPVHAAPIEVSGSIAADTTWVAGNIYIVVDDVTVEPNVTLIIEPGTIVKVHPYKAVRVNGVLKVLGTAAAPVTFTSFKDDTVGGDTNGDGAATTPVKGDWGHIVFLEDSTDAENLIEHAVIRYGGYYASPDPMCMPWDCRLESSVRFVGASPTVRDSTIEESRSYALSATIDSFPVVSGNTLTNNDGNALEMRIYPGNMTMPAVSRWSNTDVVYVLTSHATVYGGQTLILDPGVKVKLVSKKVIGVYGTLQVLGTAAAPVTFTSWKDDTVGGDTNGDGAATAPARGDWGHLAFFDGSTDAENLIEHAVIRYGGYTDTEDPGSLYYCDPNCNCLVCTNFYTPCNKCHLFRDIGSCKLYGSIRFTAASPTVRDSVIEQSRGYALSASMDSFPILSGNTLTNNEGNGLEVRCGRLTAATPGIHHWSNTDVVYALTGSVTVDRGQTLIIDPGIKVKLTANQLIGVEGVLKVLGTTAAPVTFTSLKDDTVGGDTNGDGAASTPAKGDWGHIVFFNSSVDAENLIEHAVIRHGGNVLSSSLYDYYGCKMGCVFHGVILFDNAAPTVRYSDISLNKRGLNAKSSQPVLTCNNIHANDSGLNNATPDSVVDAPNQWWGSASGPQHATNPSGTGNGVSDGVNFTPWRTLACGTPPPAPTDLKARGLSPTQISLQWLDNTADESEYRIERAAPDANPQWAEIATVSANVVAYDDGPYTCSSSPMLYRVRAYSAADQRYSDYSNVATGASAPCAPANLQASLSSPTAASLAWQDTSSDETQFDVERSTDGGATWPLVTAAPANQPLYNNPDLACSGQYQYRIRAYRSQDEAYSDYSNVVEVLTPPCAPSGAAAKNLPTGAVELVWQDNAGDESEFRIERRIETDAMWSPFGVVQANVASHVDATVSCGLAYVYRVRSYRALDDQPSAAYSNEAAVHALPCAPSALRAEVLSSGEVVLTWADSSSDETGFVVEFSINGGKDWTPYARLAAGATQATFRPLACGTAYLFRVRAQRNGDDAFSLPSDATSFTAADCPQLLLPFIRK